MHQTENIQETFELPGQDNACTDTFELCPPTTQYMPYTQIETGKTIFHDLLFTVLFLGIFAVIRLRGKDLISHAIYAMVQRKRTILLSNEGIMSNLIFYSMGLALSFSVMAVFISYITTNTFLNLYSLGIFGGMLLYHFILLFIVHFFGWTFNEKQIANEFITNLWVFHISMGLLISPFVIALFFAREQVTDSLTIIIAICLIILILVKIARWFTIFFTYKVSILYMILYLCAFELVPLLFLYKVVV